MQASRPQVSCPLARCPLTPQPQGMVRTQVPRARPRRRPQYLRGIMPQGCSGGDTTPSGPHSPPAKSCPHASTSLAVGPAALGQCPSGVTLCAAVVLLWIYTSKQLLALRPVWGGRQRGKGLCPQPSAAKKGAA